ncbi:GMC oxidoreductase [Laetiporus sulphureus 93-53]|uniref:GMC oxidoreductase n=1 Tax=Laetiporus sulphureus 93-53 TaxID=1314785 RepID=A0A165BWF4_9APHY|nr:GMC oxidoreductase [Laetiporus sulphureus 93-53]KZT01774.1 GMC oxidoreductase [Laetiporus sulphureus 93-53]
MGVPHSSKVASNPTQYATLIGESNRDGESYRQYDYVVVGGGTAGCVLASRLSEDRNSTVLLLEAGRSHEGNLLSRIPLAYTKMFKTAVDWNFQTTPQEAMSGKQVYWPQGKILGGTSAINSLVHQYCAKEDFDEWVKLGGEGWSFDDLLPYFHKAENYTASAQSPNKNNHGTNGPLHVGYSSEAAPVNQYIIETSKSMGVPYIDDINGSRSIVGLAHMPGILDPKGQRNSTAVAYLTRDVLSRPNLIVGVNVEVEKIIFSQEQGSTPRAIGVELSTAADGPRYRVNATREVILSAGSISTPQILMLSGIGPADGLSRFNIPVVKELPAVGRNMSDHISCGPLRFRAKPAYTWDRYNATFSGAVAMMKWLLTGKGPLSSMGTSMAAFIRSDDRSLPFGSKASENLPVKDLTSGPNTPDIELVWAPFVFVNFGFTPPPPGASGITTSAVALRPESTGTITLRSGSVWDKPLIDGNYFASKSDMNIVVRGTRLLMRMARTEPLASVLDLKAHSTDKDDIFWPGDADPDKITDEELKEWIRGNASPFFHPVSTARMGQSVETSVVDAKLRVHGVAGLRVVDASVFPSHLSGHPAAAVIAVAEKAADMIRSEIGA